MYVSQVKKSILNVFYPYVHHAYAWFIDLRAAAHSVIVAVID